jgi:ABC transporter substrate binding protein (PQQ-dependent alcohol dehydrogenase system)
MIARLIILVVLLATPLRAEDAARLVYIGTADDPYYEPDPLYTGLSLKDRQRPLEGARLALRDARVIGRALGVAFELDEVLANPGEVAETLRQLDPPHPLAILLDLPPQEMAEVIADSAPDDVLINLRDRSDRWRGVDCAPNLLHALASDAMLSDALAQHLRAHGWKKILLLHGPTPRDAEQTEAVKRSAAKFGLQIAADRGFELTNDPRRRDESNIALLTGGVRHDVIWLVDDVGDFGRYVPFASYDARPVVGAEGLTATAWHWTFERFGAPQLSQRFRRTTDRNMTADDWAGWAAVRAVVDAVSSVQSTDPHAVNTALQSGDLAVDLYKGVRGNFREWDGQLRQPILLATNNAVIAVAPIEGFEHQFDTLDTLGIDRPESACSR